MKNLLAAASVLALVCTSISVNAKAPTFPTKKELKAHIRESFISGTYKYTCDKFGDCVNIVRKIEAKK